MAKFELDEDTVEVKVTLVYKKTGDMRDTLSDIQRDLNQLNADVFLVESVEGKDLSLFEFKGSYELHKITDREGVWEKIDG